MTTTAEPLAEVYARDGLVQLYGVLDPAEVAQIRDVFTDQVERDRSLGFDDGITGDDPLARYPRFVHPHRRTETAAGRLAATLMFDSRIFHVIEQLIGPALGAQSMFYFKPPGARGQALHQDNLSLRAYPETCLAAWIAIDDADEHNGGLLVVPGSHTTDLACPEPADLSESFTSAGVAVPDGMTVTQTRMTAGDVLFFHGSVVHGSRPNTTTDRFRRALIYHYVPQASIEIAAFYNPLIHPRKVPIDLAEATGGGPCGVF